MNTLLLQGLMKPQALQCSYHRWTGTMLSLNRFSLVQRNVLCIPALRIQTFTRRKRTASTLGTTCSIRGILLVPYLVTRQLLGPCLFLLSLSVGMCTAQKWKGGYCTLLHLLQIEGWKEEVEEDHHPKEGMDRGREKKSFLHSHTSSFFLHVDRRPCCLPLCTLPIQ